MNVYIATINTGGISHGGRAIIALGSSPEQATKAAVRKLLGKTPYITPYGDRLVTTQDVIDYYGIGVTVATVDGPAIEGVD